MRESEREKFQGCSVCTQEHPPDLRQSPQRNRAQTHPKCTTPRWRRCQELGWCGQTSLRGPSACMYPGESRLGEQTQRRTVHLMAAKEEKDQERQRERETSNHVVVLGECGSPLKGIDESRLAHLGISCGHTHASVYTLVPIHTYGCLYRHTYTHSQHIHKEGASGSMHIPLQTTNAQSCSPTSPLFRTDTRTRTHTHKQTNHTQTNKHTKRKHNPHHKQTNKYACMHRERHRHTRTQ